jgi:hypothetical protein
LPFEQFKIVEHAGVYHRTLKQAATPCQRKRCGIDTGLHLERSRTRQGRKDTIVWHLRYELGVESGEEYVTVAVNIHALVSAEQPELCSVQVAEAKP